MDILIWAILVVAFVIAEVATVQLVSIWLAFSAFVTMICAWVFDGISFLSQATIFTVLSAVLLVITIPIIRKRRKDNYVATNSELNIGKTANVIETVDPDKSCGRVTLDGVDWSAVPENGKIIPQGSIVTVTAVKGSKLEVKLKEEK